MNTTLAAQTLAAHLVAVAADRDSFMAMTKDRRGGGTRLALMRGRMAMAQGHVCPACGNALDGETEWSHLIPKGYFGGEGANGGARMGWVDGNMTVMHKSCNRDNGESVWTVDRLARPDVVFLGMWRDLPMLPR